ncbi:MAG TPA: hypothetical protein VE863_09635 [Pyrinomonadaceae bacterium]|jgi:hypothetical protein|nr:hypothetical protein [Pyrinomonadaceae bacterium]
MINRLTIFSSAALLFFASTTFGQSSFKAGPPTEVTDATARAVAALDRLDNDVIVYRSIGDFEKAGRLARVPVAVFEQHLSEVSAEVMPVLNKLPAGKLKNQLTNAMDSYRDGLFWWRQVDDPHVVNVAALSYTAREPTAADAALRATIPYTVAIHWRQAHKYLRQAEQSLGRP